MTLRARPACRRPRCSCSERSACSASSASGGACRRRGSSPRSSCRRRSRSLARFALSADRALRRRDPARASRVAASSASPTASCSAAAVGVPLGLLMGWFRWLDDIVTPVFDGLRFIAPIAWVPFAALWFGTGIGGPIMIIFSGAFPPCLINAYRGARFVDRTLHRGGADARARATCASILRGAAAGLVPLDRRGPARLRRVSAGSRCRRRADRRLGGGRVHDGAGASATSRRRPSWPA